MTRASRLELEIWSLKLPILPIKLYSSQIVFFFYIRKRVDLNHQVLNTIFSKYLALPMATFPLVKNLRFLIKCFYN